MGRSSSPAISASLQEPKPPDPPDEMNRTVNSNHNVNDTMVINMDHVVINTTRKLTYKVIRVINHFIQHVIKYYSDIDKDITESSSWYVKWNTIYPIIRSSRRTIVEVHRLLFDDYLIKEEDINLFDLVMSLVVSIPHLKSSYDIVQTNTHNSLDEFQFKLHLYRGKLEDSNNTYSPIEEAESLPTMYRPFTDSRSISTWHTVKTKTSKDNIPQDVEVTSKAHEEEESQVTDHSKYLKDDSPKESSTQTTDNSKNAKDPEPTSFLSKSSNTQPKKVKFTKNQQIMIRDELKSTCQMEIRQSMQGLTSLLTNLMIQQNQMIQNKKNRMHNRLLFKVNLIQCINHYLI